MHGETGPYSRLVEVALPVLEEQKETQRDGERAVLALFGELWPPAEPLVWSHCEEGRWGQRRPNGSWWRQTPPSPGALAVASACVTEASGRAQGDFSLSMSLGPAASSALRSLPLTVSFLVGSRVGQPQSLGTAEYALRTRALCGRWPCGEGPEGKWLLTFSDTACWLGEGVGRQLEERRLWPKRRGPDPWACPQPAAWPLAVCFTCHASGFSSVRSVILQLLRFTVRTK